MIWRQNRRNSMVLEEQLCRICNYARSYLLRSMLRSRRAWNTSLAKMRRNSSSYFQLSITSYFEAVLQKYVELVLRCIDPRDSNSRATQQYNMSPHFHAIDCQINGGTACSTFLLAWKCNWLARTCIMKMHYATCMVTQTSKVPSRVALLFIFYDVVCAKWKFMLKQLVTSGLPGLVIIFTS